MFGFPPYLPFPRLVGAVSNCDYVGRLQTAPTVPPFGRHCFQLRLCVRLQTAPTVLPFAPMWGGYKPHLPFPRLVGAVSNCAYVGRLQTAPTVLPTAPMRGGYKPHLPFPRLVGAVSNCAVSTHPTAPTGGQIGKKKAAECPGEGHSTAISGECIASVTSE